MPLFNFEELVNKANQPKSQEEADIQTLRENQQNAISAMSGMVRMLDTIIRGAGTLTLPKHLDVKSIAVPYMSVLWSYTRSNYHCVDCYVEKFFAGNKNLFRVFEMSARKHKMGYDDGISVLGDEWVMSDSSAYHQEHREYEDEVEFHQKYTTCVVCSKVDRCHFCHEVDREDYYSGKYFKELGLDPRTLPGDADSF